MRPWEIVYIFKQVLEDALGSKGGQPGGLAAGSTGAPAQPACPGDCTGSSDKDEIPTVSSYVDRNRKNRLPECAHRTQNLPCDRHPVGLLGWEVFRGPPPGQGTRHQE